MGSYASKNLYERMTDRQGRLETLRSPYDPVRSDIIDHYLLDLDSWGQEDASSRVRSNTVLYETGSGARASRIMAKGIYGYMVSRSSAWIQHLLPDMKGIDEVNQYLQRFDDHILGTYRKSTFYDVLSRFCLLGVTVGAPVLLSYEDLESGKIVCMVPDTEQTYLGQNALSQVDVYHRKFKRTAKDAAQLFKDKGRKDKTDKKPNQLLSDDLIHNLEIGEHYTEHEFIHAIYHHSDPIFEDLPETDAEYKPKRLWVEIYIQTGATAVDKQKPLRFEGYPAKPFSCWRCDNNFSGVYPVTPAWYALPDVKSLQEVRKDRLQTGRLSVRPPMWILKALLSRAELFPKGLTWYNPAERDDIPKPIFTGQEYPISEDMEQTIKRDIDEWFNVPFFLMLTALAQEKRSSLPVLQVSEMLGEKAILMGPMIESFENVLEEVDNMMIDTEGRANNLPDVPDIVMMSSHGDLRPEFIGPLAQMQKRRYGISKFVDALSVITPLLQSWPEAKMVIDGQVTAERILEEFHFDQECIVPEDERAAIMRAMQQKQEAMETVNVVKELGPVVQGAMSQKKVA